MPGINMRGRNACPPLGREPRPCYGRRSWRYSGYSACEYLRSISRGEEDTQMLALLRRISARDYVSAPMRLSLMVGGIASGIALIAALGVINRSVLANFRVMLERAAGKAALQVTLGTGEVGFAESVAEEDLTRYPITLATERRRVLEAMADPRSILLTEAFARRRRVEIGEVIKLATPRGVLDFTVQGLLAAEGLALVFGGQLAVMDLPAAQFLLGKDERVDQIDVVLRPGSDVNAVQRRLEERLPAS